MGDTFSRILRNTHERYPEEQRNAAAAKVEMGALVAILEGALANSDYLLGNAFTFADLPAFGFCAFGALLGAVDFAACPRVKAWVDHCSARPALARAQAM